jgi:hypothetical protein
MVLAAGRAPPEDSFGPEGPNTTLLPERIVVCGQGQEPDSIGVTNASHGLLAVGANQNCARPAFVDLLFGIAGRLGNALAYVRGAFNSHGELYPEDLVSCRKSPVKMRNAQNQSNSLQDGDPAGPADFTLAGARR